IFRRNTTGFNRLINALTDAFTVRLTSAVAFTTSRRLGAFTIAFVVIIVIVAPAATTTIFFVSTVTRVGTVVATTVTRVGTVVAATVTRVGTVVAATVTRVGTVVATTVTRVGTVIAAIISTVVSTVGRTSWPAVIAAAHVASASVISTASIVASTNTGERIEGGRKNDITLTIDHAEIRSRERIHIDIIFAFRAQLERAASGATTFALGCDTSQGCSIFTRHNLVDGFSLEPINTDHGLLKNIPYGSKDDQATGPGFTLSAIRALIAFGTLTAITTATSSISFIVAFSIVCGIVVICASRLAFAVIGFFGFSDLFFFGHGRRC
ncbi:MAG: hypothetical protein VCD16_07975, partial [Planctomycetota bacterium]